MEDDFCLNSRISRVHAFCSRNQSMSVFFGGLMSQNVACVSEDITWITIEKLPDYGLPAAIHNCGMQVYNNLINIIDGIEFISPEPTCDLKPESLMLESPSSQLLTGALGDTKLPVTVLSGFLGGILIFQPIF